MKILVPGDQSMVALLGQRDELLKLVEAAFDSVIVVRGNEITITGPQEEAERVGVLFEELLSLLERGHDLTASSVGRSIELIKGNEAKPTEVLGDVLLTGRGRGISRHRPGGDRQDLPRGGHRGSSPPGQDGVAHHPHPPGCGGR